MNFNISIIFRLHASDFTIQPCGYFWYIALIPPSIQAVLIKFTALFPRALFWILIGKCIFFNVRGFWLFLKKKNSKFRLVNEWTEWTELTCESFQTIFCCCIFWAALQCSVLCFTFFHRQRAYLNIITH